MKEPRRWLGGFSVGGAVIICTLALTAWDRIDKLIGERDSLRDERRRLNSQVTALIVRADNEDVRDLSENAWRRNAESEQRWIVAGLHDVLLQLGIKPPPGPYLEEVPHSVTSERTPAIGLLPDPTDIALIGMAP